MRLSPFPDPQSRDVVPDSLRGLDLSRSRSAVERVREVAICIAVEVRGRLHTIHRSLSRLREKDAGRVLREILQRLPGGWGSPATLAVDATGLIRGAVSIFFVRRMYHHTQRRRAWRHC
jgi:hypothetical protein